MKPGFHDNVPAQTYHAAPGISRSGLARFARNPRRFRYGPPDHSGAFAFGKLAHTAILEPLMLDRRYRPSDLNTFNDAHHAYQKEQAAALGRELVKRADYDRARRIADAVMLHPTARLLLTAPMVIERSFVWVDPTTGVLCRSRPDGIDLKSRIVVELKTAEDASPAAFSVATRRYHYHWQPPFYANGIDNTLQWRPEAFVFIVIEKEEPFLTATYELIARTEQRTGDEIHTTLRRYADCVAQDNWPGHSDDIEPLDLPSTPWRS